ncbi:hypothetical protein VTN00DRAFT_6141 [Thermoascus crustaceus]|uniref:uncharacterized protein n=1 Tax=Thermoascus crustaceus TaxID=5088 RepID=UPI0037449FD6
MVTYTLADGSIGGGDAIRCGSSSATAVKDTRGTSRQDQARPQSRFQLLVQMLRDCAPVPQGNLHARPDQLVPLAGHKGSQISLGDAHIDSDAPARWELPEKKVPSSHHQKTSGDVTSRPSSRSTSSFSRPSSSPSSSALTASLSVLVSGFSIELYENERDMHNGFGSAQSLQNTVPSSNPVVTQMREKARLYYGKDASNK